MKRKNAATATLSDTQRDAARAFMRKHVEAIRAAEALGEVLTRLRAAADGVVQEFGARAILPDALPNKEDFRDLLANVAGMTWQAETMADLLRGVSPSPALEALLGEIITGVGLDDRLGDRVTVAAAQWRYQNVIASALAEIGVVAPPFPLGMDDQGDEADVTVAVA